MSPFSRSLLRMTAALVLLCASPVASAAPDPPAPVPTAGPCESTGEAEAAITRALGEWVEATNRGDPAKASDVWAPGVVGWFPKLSAVALDQAYRVAGAGKPSDKKPWSTYKLSIDEILVSGDLAIVRDLWGETVHFPGISATAYREIRSFEVWRPQPDGKWRITRWISAPEAWAKGR